MRPLRKSVARTELLREMSFLDHLDELRGVIVSAVMSLLVAAIIFWCVSGPILEWMIAGIPVDHLVFNAPSEAFMVRTKLSFILGALAVFPYIAYRLWRFVSPGLFRRESHRIMPVVMSSALLFYTGITFCYFLVVPLIIQFMLGYATARVQPLITVSAYFDTVSRLCLAFGLVFQLPIAMLLLSVTGLVSPRTFLGKWRYAIVIIFTASAIFTPPDVASQVLMAVPLCVLYIGSSLISLIVVRRRERSREET
jgi:sec-independent protein translocase protein TatC